MSAQEKGKKQAVVIGAGVSGLSTAHALLEKGYTVRVIDRMNRPGGIISTERTPYGLVESAANACIASDRMEAISAQIGVPLLPLKKEARARYIWRETRPTRMPLTFREILDFIPRLIRFLFLKSFKPARVLPERRESVRNWGTRVLGAPITERLLLPALQGIYAGSSETLSANIIIGPLFHKKPKRKGRLKGSVAPQDGMGAWMIRWKEYLSSQGVEFQFGAEFKKEEIAQFPDTKFYFCGSLGETKKLIPGLPFEKAQTLTLSTVTIFYKPDPQYLKGFGVLFPEDSRFESLGVLFNDCTFPGRTDVRSETWIVGGIRGKQLVEKDSSEIISAVKGDRLRLLESLGIKGSLLEVEPLEIKFNRWKDAVPHCDLDLEAALQEKIELPPNLFLIGNYLGKLGMAKIVDYAFEVVGK